MKWPFHRRQRNKAPHGFFGGYQTWDEASAATVTYAADSVVEGMMERRRLFLEEFGQSPTFIDNRGQQLLAAVAPILPTLQGRPLRVLDFGGSSGLYFYVLKRALPTLEIDWTVVETEETVKAHASLQEDHLHWRPDLPETGPGFDLALASGAMPYVPKPYEILERLARLARFVIVTRQPVLPRPEDTVVVQKVPRNLFEGSFPSWLFSAEKFSTFMAGLGTIRQTWEVPQDQVRFEGKPVRHVGYLVKTAVRTSP